MILSVPLSLAGNMQGIYAERSGLVWEWLRVIDEMREKPRILALENVTGLLSANHGENYTGLHNALVKRGYRCGAVAINSDIFVPQSRPRVFVIAVKRDIDIPEKLVSDGPTWLHNKAAKDVGERLDEWIWWNTDKPGSRNIEAVPDFATFCKKGLQKTYWKVENQQYGG